MSMTKIIKAYWSWKPSLCKLAQFDTPILENDTVKSGIFEKDWNYIQSNDRLLQFFTNEQ